MQLQRSTKTGFTLVELLVVIAIIAVLTALGLGVMSTVQQEIHAALCQNNQRTLMRGFLAFAVDHDNTLPGGYCGTVNNDPIPWQCDWLESQEGNPLTAPQGGTIFPYMGNNYAVYLCPGTSDRIDDVGHGFDPGDYVSNGRFDYTVFGAWDGAPVRTIKPQARFWNSNGTYTYLPTPIICEEETSHINYGNAEGDHSSGDGFAHRHYHGAYYACIDGSVAFYIEPAVGGSGQAGGFNWQSIAPSGTWQCIGTFNPNPGSISYTGWGFWAHQ